MNSLLAYHGIAKQVEKTILVPDYSPVILTCLDWGKKKQEKENLKALW